MLYGTEMNLSPGFAVLKLHNIDDNSVISDKFLSPFIGAFDSSKHCVLVNARIPLK